MPDETNQKPNAHANVWIALAAAQAEMSGASKSSRNPHFQSSYADLSEVVDAAKPALTRHGLCWYAFPESQEGRPVMTTVVHHGASDTRIACSIPLFIAKNDMQGFGSASTYARRYGLMSLAGIAPEDDDGNEASGKGGGGERQRPAPRRKDPEFLKPPSSAKEGAAKSSAKEGAAKAPAGGGEDNEAREAFGAKLLSCMIRDKEANQAFSRLLKRPGSDWRAMPAKTLNYTMGDGWAKFSEIIAKLAAEEEEQEQEQEAAA